MIPPKRAFVGAQTMLFLEEEAAKRQEASRAKPGEKIGEANVVVNLPPPMDQGKSREKAAELVGVSPSLIQQAKKVRDEGSSPPKFFPSQAAPLGASSRRSPDP